MNVDCKDSFSQWRFLISPVLQVDSGCLVYWEFHMVGDCNPKRIRGQHRYLVGRIELFVGGEVQLRVHGVLQCLDDPVGSITLAWDSATPRRVGQTATLALVGSSWPPPLCTLNNLTLPSHTCHLQPLAFCKII